jgi:hypothetical protein
MMGQQLKETFQRFHLDFLSGLLGSVRMSGRGYLNSTSQVLEVVFANVVDIVLTVFVQKINSEAVAKRETRARELTSLQDDWPRGICQRQKNRSGPFAGISAQNPQGPSRQMHQRRHPFNGFTLASI